MTLSSSDTSTGAAPGASGGSRSQAARRTTGRAVGAISSQFVQAAGSLVLQVMAARTLGATQFGTFTLFFAILVAVTAGYTAWVGDSLTVLDRGATGVRSALQVSAVAGGAGLGLVIGLVVALTGLTSVRDGALFAVVVAAWLFEETARRLFMTRLQFWRVVSLDTTYVVVSALVAAAWLAAPGRAGLDTFLVALLVGQSAAVLLGVVLLPRSTWRWDGWQGEGLRLVAAFGAYRGLQAGTRPTVLLVARLLVAATATRAALGSLEAARLLVAPSLLLVSGAGSFLLPTLARMRTSVRANTFAERSTVLLVGGASAVGVVAVAAAGALGPKITGHNFPVHTLAVAAWSCYAVSVAATMPYATLATARTRARAVFLVRSLEAVVGLLLVGLLLVLPLDIDVSTVPFALAAAGIIGAVLMRRVGSPLPVSAVAPDLPTPVADPAAATSGPVVDPSAVAARSASSPRESS